MLYYSFRIYCDTPDCDHKYDTGPWIKADPDHAFNGARSYGWTTKMRKLKPGERLENAVIYRCPDCTKKRRPFAKTPNDLPF